MNQQYRPLVVKEGNRRECLITNCPRADGQNRCTKLGKCRWKASRGFIDWIK